MSKKNAKAPVDPDIQEALSELFTDSDYAGYFDYDIIELAPIGRILTAVTALGGSVAFYSRGGDPGIKLFIRVGERSKSYTFETEDQFNELIEQIANPWVSAFGKWLSLKYPTKPIAISPQEGARKGKSKDPA